MKRTRMQETVLLALLTAAMQACGPSGPGDRTAVEPARKALAASELAVTVAGPFAFQRSDGEPVIQRVTFAVATAGAATLLIHNGSPSRVRVSSAVIELNGEVVLGPEAFNQNVETLAVPVLLQAGANVLGVEVRSKPGSGMMASFEATADAIRLVSCPSSIAVGETLTCVASVTALGSPVSNAMVHFSVSELGDVPSAVVTTDSAGLASGILSGFLEPGNGVLTASLDELDPPLFVSVALEVTGVDEVVSQAQATISPGGGIVEIAGAVQVELGEDLSRPTLDITLEQLSGLAHLRRFRAILAEQGQATASSDTFLRVSLSSSPAGPMALRMPIPGQVLEALAGGGRAELYVEVVGHGSDGEVLTTLEPLLATYDVAHGQVVGVLPPTLFAESASGMLRAMSAVGIQTVGVSATIIVAVNNSQLTIPVTGQFTEPSSTTVDVSVRDTVQFAANLTASVQELSSPANGAIVSQFGIRNGVQHNGIDVDNVMGTPIQAAADGRVTRSGWQNPANHAEGYGYRVRITHPDGSETVYAHLQEAGAIAEGTVVGAGQQIGTMGATGHVIPGPGSDGSHLHFELRRNGAAVDPEAFLPGGAQPYLGQLGLAAYINGVLVPGSSMQWPGVPTADYVASVAMSTLSLAPGQDYPIEVRLSANGGATVPVFTGTLKLRATALRTVLTWDTNDTDVDTHVYDSYGNHAWYGDLNGIPGASLDHDDVDGYGPETFSMDRMEPDTLYTVSAHYYSDHGNGPTTATMRVYVDGQLVTTISVLLATRQWMDVGVYPMTPNSPFAVQAVAASVQPFSPDPVNDPELVEVPGIPKLRFRLLPK